MNASTMAIEMNPAAWALPLPPALRYRPAIRHTWRIKGMVLAAHCAGIGLLIAFTSTPAQFREKVQVIARVSLMQDTPSSARIEPVRPKEHAAMPPKRSAPQLVEPLPRLPNNSLWLPTPTDPETAPQTHKALPTAASVTLPTASAPIAADQRPAEPTQAPPPVVQPSSDADYLNNPAPPYPRQSKRMGEAGTVVIRVFINALGEPEQAEVRQSSGYYRLDESALQTVRRWRFVPGRRAGVAEGMWFNVPVRFVLD